MFWYAIAILTSLFLAVLWSKTKLNVNKISYSNYLEFKGREYHKIRHYLIILLIALLPLIVMAIRYDVGTDYLGTYTIDFHLINNGYHTRNEPISVLLYKFAGVFSDEAKSYFAIAAIICVFFSYIGIYKLSVKPIYSIALYFFTYQYFTSMNSVRQMIASAVVIVIVPLLLKKKYMWFCVGVILAGLIHYAAFTYIILIPLYYLELSFKNSLYILGGAFIALNLLKQPIYFIIEKTVYGHYLTDSVEYGASAIFTVVNIIVYLIMGLYARKSERYRFWMNIQMVIILICFVQNIIPLAGRVLQLFSYFRMIIIPEIIVNIKSKQYRTLFSMGIMLFYIAYCIYGMVLSNWDSVLPYQTIFQ